MNQRIEWGEDENDNIQYWLNPANREPEPFDAQVARNRVLDQLNNLAYTATRERLAELRLTAYRLSKMVAADDASRLAAEDAEWTRERTTEARAAWNAAVKSGRYTVMGTLHQSKVEAAVGFGMATLKRQVARHGL